MARINQHVLSFHCQLNAILTQTYAFINISFTGQMSCSPLQHIQLNTNPVNEIILITPDKLALIATVGPPD